MNFRNFHFLIELNNEFRNVFRFICAAGIRRIQRVSDVNAMGYSTSGQPSSQPSYVPQPHNTFVPDNTAAPFNYNDPSQNSNYGVQSQAQPRPNYSNVPQNPYYDPYSNNAAPYANQPTQYPSAPAAPAAIFDPNSAPNPNSGPQNSFPGQFSMLQQPMVQDMALQYGQRLADQGKQLVEANIEKYVPVTRLKYYFAVDNNYVVKKLILLLFPFTHRVNKTKTDSN